MKRIPIILSALLAAFLAFGTPARGGDAPEPVFTTQADGKVTFTVHGQGQSKDVARENAIEEAQKVVAKYLLARDRSVSFTPSREFILAKLKKGDVVYTDLETSSSVIGVVYDAGLTLELSPQVEQYFRKAGRVTSGLWGVGCAMAAFLVIGLFFRIDEWTKGYLTTWLFFAAVGIISGLAVLWIW